MRICILASLLAATLVTAPASAATILFKLNASGSDAGVNGTGSFMTTGDDGVFTLASGLTSFELSGQTGSMNVAIQEYFSGDYSVSKGNLASFSVTLAGGMVTALSFETETFVTDQLIFGVGYIGLPTVMNTIAASGVGPSTVTAVRDGRTFTGYLELTKPDPTSRGGGAGAVPEPATWAMMMLGFGLVGGAMRRRSAAARAVAA